MTGPRLLFWEIRDTVAEYEFPVVGVSFENPDGTHRQTILGILFDQWWSEDRIEEVEVSLQREPDNEHDSNAVSVWVETPDRHPAQIGYLSKEVNFEVGEWVEEDSIQDTWISEMGAASGGGVWAKISIEAH